MIMTPNLQPHEKNGFVSRMMRTLDIFATSQQNDEAALLLGMTADAIARLQSHADRMTTEAMYWQDRYKRIRRSYDELMKLNINLEEENARLLLEYRQLEADYRMRSENDSPEDVNRFVDEKERQECTPVPDEALLEAALNYETSTPMTNSGSLYSSGDVCKHLHQFKDSLDTKLEEVQKQSEQNDEKGSLDSESEQASSSPCSEVLVGKTLPVSPLQDKTPSKGDVSGSNRSPFQLIRRVFPTQSDDVSMPATTTSDCMFSLASDHSISSDPRTSAMSSYMRQTKSSAAKRVPKRDGCSKSSDSMFSLASGNSFSMRSRGSDFCSLTPSKTTMGMSSQRNVEWAIIE